MKKSTLITRIVCLSISLVLLIVAMVLSSGGKSVIAGAGSGRNEKITSVDEMSDMLESFSKQFSGFNYAFADGAEPVKYSVADDSSSSKIKYTSGTMHETTSMSVSAYSRFEGGSYDFSASMQRDMTTYVTEDAAYYVIDCIVSGSTYVSGGTESRRQGSNVSMNIELYMDKYVALVKFNRYSMASSGMNLTGMEKILGKWIEFDAGDSSVSSLISVNNSNYAVLSLIGEYIEAYRSTGFDKSGSVYTLKDTAFKSFVSRVLAINGVTVDLSNEKTEISGELGIDLSNNNNPKVNFILSEKYNESSVSSSAYENDMFEFKNINNTVIRLPDNIKPISVEELEELLEESNGRS